MNAQPVGFWVQFDQVSAEPSVLNEPAAPPSKSTRPEYEPHARKSPTLAVHVPGIGLLDDGLSASPGPPPSSSSVVLPFGSVSWSLQSPERSLATETLIEELPGFLGDGERRWHRA